MKRGERGDVVRNTFLILIFTILLSAWYVGQDRQFFFKQYKNEVKGFYKEPHKLRKMFVSTEKITVKEPGKGHLSGGFFLFFGGISGDYQEGTETSKLITHVRFAWEQKDNVYIITTLPLEKFRVKLVETALPTASFSLKEFTMKEWDDDKFRQTIINSSEGWDAQVDYVTFTISKDDWPTDIRLPLNQGYYN